MPYLGGKSDCWKIFNWNHRKAIVETLLMVTSSFYFSKIIPVIFQLKHRWFSFTSPKISCFKGENEIKPLITCKTAWYTYNVDWCEINEIVEFSHFSKSSAGSRTALPHWFWNSFWKWDSSEQFLGIAENVTYTLLQCK